MTAGPAPCSEAGLATAEPRSCRTDSGQELMAEVRRLRSLGRSCTGKRFSISDSDTMCVGDAIRLYCARDCPRASGKPVVSSMISITGIEILVVVTDRPINYCDNYRRKSTNRHAATHIQHCSD